MKSFINQKGDASGPSRLQNVKIAGQTILTGKKFNLSVRWGKVVSLLLVLLLLAACGGAETTDTVTEQDGAETAVETTEETTSEDAAPEEAVEEETAEEEAVEEEMVEEEMVEEEMTETRTLTDALEREVTIPVEPQRVVALSEIDLDSLLALDIVPVGAPNGRGQMTLPTYLLPIIEGQTTSIGGIGEPNLETILTLEPDLIVVSSPSEAVAELIPQLEQIAPVVVPYVYNNDWHWKTVFNAVADAVDRSAEAEAWLAAYEEHAAEIGEQLSNGVREVSIVRWMGDGPRILLTNAFSSDVLSDAGFIRPEHQLDLEGTHPVHTDVISMEQIDLVDADVVFAGGLNPDGDAAMDDALANPLVQSLSAVQNNRLFQVDGLAWSSTGGPMAALEVLADVENALAEIGETMDAGETADAFPVTIEHKFGSTTIPEQPVRVVSVGYSEQDELLALGVIPVGLRYWYGDHPYAVWPWAQDELGDAQPEIIAEGEINFEAITELEPDLIVGITSGMTQEEYDLLSQIAPTVAQSDAYVDYGVPWQEVTRVLGQATGNSEKAEEIVTNLENRFAEIRESHPEFDEATLAVAFAWGGSPGAYASQDARPRLLSELGFVTPEVYDEIAGDSFYLSFSEEEMPEYLDVDVVVWLAGSDEGIQEIRDNPLRATLRVAQEGRELFLGELLGGAFSFSSPLSINYLLDELVPMLEAAADGDPETAVPGN